MKTYIRGNLFHLVCTWLMDLSCATSGAVLVWGSLSMLIGDKNYSSILLFLLGLAIALFPLLGDPLTYIRISNRDIQISIRKLGIPWKWSGDTQEIEKITVERYDFGDGEVYELLIKIKSLGLVKLPGLNPSTGNELHKHTRAPFEEIHVTKPSRSLDWLALMRM